MEYTTLILMSLGLLGIFMHNLVEINKLNHQSNGNFKLKPYLQLEWASILISFCVLIAAVIAKQEIKQLEAAGKFLGLAFIAIGYMAQSILIALMGKAQKIIDKNQ